MENLARDQRALEISKIGYWEYNFPENHYYASDILYSILGIRREQFPKISIEAYLTFVVPEDRATIMESFSDPHLSSFDSFHRITRSDGEIRYIHNIGEVTRNDQHEVVGMAGTLQDITERKVKELRMEQSEEKFRSLIQNASDIIGIINPDGMYSYASNNLLPILGYNPPDLLGKNAFDFIHPDDKEMVLEKLAGISVSKTVQIGAFRFLHANNEWRWLETTLTNLLNDPFVKGIVTNSRDITERKHAEDSVRLLSLIARKTVNAVVITDRSGYITWVNNGFSDITGYSAADAIGQKPGDLLQGEETDRKTIREMSEKIRTMEPFNVEVINYNKRKQKYWIRIQCQPLRDEDGRILGFFAIQTDISKQKLLQFQLKQEIENRQKRITAAVIRLQERDRATISRDLHDNINQILTTVKLYNELSLEGGGDSVSLIQKSVIYLNNCIEEIRNISQFLSTPTLGSISLKDSLTELMHSLDITNQVKIQFDARDLENCTLEEDIHLAIYRISQEHLTNIIRHSDADHLKVLITIDGRNLQISFNDNGKGFDPLQSRKGAGIKNMTYRAEALGGKLQIKSAPGQGCILKVSLPLESVEWNKESEINPVNSHYL